MKGLKTDSGKNVVVLHSQSKPFIFQISIEFSSIVSLCSVAMNLLVDLFKVTEAEKKKEINHDIKTEPLTLA